MKKYDDNRKDPSNYLVTQGCSKGQNGSIQLSNCYGTLTFDTRKAAENFLKNNGGVSVVKPKK